ncbi:MAG: metallophosphoesterase [Phycisphaerae bacterium]|nr:metallophosphoesterase [Phycisphaerae bacterium]
MSRRFLFVAAAILSAYAAVAPASGKTIPDTVAGVVFMDTNRNGRMDTGEKPVARARVTDGVSIVTTDAGGAYSIKIGDDPTTPRKGSRVVSVCWPEGTWPTGKWWARLDQIADATKVNFPLRADKQELPFAFMHVSDDHAAGATYGKVAPAAGRLKPFLRFCINTGDSAQSSFESDAPMATLARNAAKFVVPVMSVPGNHDIVGKREAKQPDKHPLAWNGAYTKNLGPVRWSFDYAGARFVGLDWFDPSIPHSVNGSVPRVAADWMDKDLASVKPGARIFVFVHFPNGCAKFGQVIAKYKVAHLFGGHNHRHKYYNAAGSPAVTAINFMAGGNLVIVEKDGFTPAEFCLGYKGPTHHSKRCSLSYPRRGWTGSLKARHGEACNFPAGNLSGNAKPLDTSAGVGVHIEMEVTPGKAKKVGVRIGKGSKAIEIAWTGNMLNVAGVPVPFGWEAYDKKTLLWNIAIDGGRIEFYGNKRYHLSKVLDTGAVGAVTFFAEGGQAVVKTARAWPLKKAQ